MPEFKSMKDQMHIASQYLAAANISFLEKKADDSHTNVGFDTDTMRMETYDLSSTGDRLSLNYRRFSLEWTSQNGTISLSLDGKTHREVLHWLQERSQVQLAKDYVYEFHYELPYTIDSDFQFKLTDASKLEHLCNLRILAEYTLEHIVEANNLDSPVRIWPHHFDTGAYALLDTTSGISIGLGMAIPDTLSDEHYFYISGYKDGKAILPSSYSNLSFGKWSDQGFIGAILPVTNLVKSETTQFFQEAIDQFKN